MRTDSEKFLDECPRVLTAGKYANQVFRQWAGMNNDTYGAMSFDTETTSLTFNIPSVLHTGKSDIIVNGPYPFGISLAVPAKNEVNLFWGKQGTDLYDDMCNFLSGVKGYKVAHNLKYDVRVLEGIGVKVKEQTDCTLTMARLVWNRRMDFGLKELAPILGISMGWGKELKAVLRNIRSSYTRAGYPKGYVNYSFIPEEIISDYAIIDAFATYLLNIALRKDINQKHRQVYCRERKIIDITKDMECTGMYFSRRQATIEINKLEPKIPKLQEKLFKLANEKFNPNSPKQLHEVFLENLKVPKRQLLLKGKVSTDYKKILKKVLIKTKRARVKKFIETLHDLKVCYKLLNTYLHPLRKRAKINKGVIYCNINPTDSRTGRMTITDPALQTIPRPTDEEGAKNEVRHCFVAKPGYYNLFIDYNQMEMWIFAVTAGEEKMLEAFRNGLDIHQYVADSIYGNSSKNVIASKIERQKCKQVNFGIIYGMGFRTLAEEMKIPVLEAYDLRKSYLEEYPRIEEFTEDCKKKLRHDGYVKDIFGRRYNLEVRDAYKAINCLVQGGCAQILKIVMIKIDKYLRSRKEVDKLNPDLVLPIHDELIIQVPKKVKQLHRLIWDIQEIMENIPQLQRRGIRRLPTEAAISGGSWEEKHSIWLPAYTDN